MSLREAIATASSGREVSGSVLEAAFGEIMDDAASPVQIAALLVALRTKGETVPEIVAAARALRKRAVPMPRVSDRVVDTCGTGGDGAGTFNISTTAAFVAAGAGVPVAKHGNRAASGQTGSFDVLEALGVRIDLPLESYIPILESVGIAPFFARSAHPAMRFMAPVRQELGIRTLMNCLGPLLNPVAARHQIVGVYDSALVEPLAAALGELGAIRAVVVHGEDGLDELTTTAESIVAVVEANEVRVSKVTPGDLGIATAQPADLAGGDAEENAALLEAVLRGESGPHRDIVVLNAAGALWAAGQVDRLEEGLEPARKSIDSGAAHQKLEALVRATQEADAGVEAGGKA